jgi:hypothetical protein
MAIFVLLISNHPKEKAKSPKYKPMKTLSDIFEFLTNTQLQRPVLIPIPIPVKKS